MIFAVIYIFFAEKYLHLYNSTFSGILYIYIHTIVIAFISGCPVRLANKLSISVLASGLPNARHQI